MTKKQLRDFAKTKHKGLPDKKETEDDDNGESVEEQTMGMMSRNERERYLADLERKQFQGTLETPTGRGSETSTTRRKGPKIVIKSSYERDEECGCDEEENEEDPRSMKTKKDLIKNKLRAMGLKMSYEPDGEMIDEEETAIENVRKKIEREFGPGAIFDPNAPKPPSKKGKRMVNMVNMDPREIESQGRYRLDPPSGKRLQGD